MNSLFAADHASLCSSGALALVLVCVASAALGAAAVAAVALFAGDRQRKSSGVVVGKKKAKFPPLAPTEPAVAPCYPGHGGEEDEHELDENAAPSSSAAAEPSNKGDPFDARPRSSYLSWDDYFMALAFLSAQRSKDPNKQVGACIVSPDRIILGIGYNGFPRGCADSKLPWAKKSATGGALATKYPYVCHAEMNAVLNKNAASVAGATLYVTMFPCNECSKLLIQAGIGEVVFYEDKQADGRPASSPAGGGVLPEESYAASRTLLSLAGVTTRQHAPAEALVLRVAPLDEAAAKGRKSESTSGGGVVHSKAA